MIFFNRENSAEVGFAGCEDKDGLKYPEMLEGLTQGGWWFRTG